MSLIWWVHHFKIANFQITQNIPQSFGWGVGAWASGEHTPAWLVSTVDEGSEREERDRATEEEVLNSSNRHPHGQWTTSHDRSRRPLNNLTNSSWRDASFFKTSLWCVITSSFVEHSWRYQVFAFMLMTMQSHSFFILLSESKSLFHIVKYIILK